MLIKDKVAVVTGGLSGLGLATAQKLESGGAKVAIFDINRATDRLFESNGNVRVLNVDVTNEGSVKAAINETIRAFGAIHICINCAGVSSACKTVGKGGPHPLDAFKTVLDINLNGTFNVLRLAASEMAKNVPMNESGERGVIVNTSSGAAFDGQMGQAAYAASKAGVCGMTLPIARDLSNLGIRINTIAPGLFMTSMAKALPEKVVDGLIEMIEFPKRLGNPSEFADLVAHIVENSYLNGEVIRIDAAIRPRPR